ncbi:Nitrogen regulation protein NtrX [Desulfovibrio sp. DV]|nr:Nitrogen regulation protein NtrX [Desulfovibrio sp. DV]
MSIGAQQTRKTILVVDDDPHILEVLEVRLVSAGYDVITATDGLEALDVLSRKTVRLVISDIRMPAWTGCGCLRRWRSATSSFPSSF